MCDADTLSTHILTLSSRTCFGFMLKEKTIQTTSSFHNVLGFSLTLEQAFFKDYYVGRGDKQCRSLDIGFNSEFNFL